MDNQLISQQQEKVEIPGKGKTNYKRLFNIYLLPLFVGILFIILILTLVIPKIFEIISSFEVLNEKNAIYAEKNTLLDQLKVLNQMSPTLSKNLNSVNQVTTADQTQVVSFRNKVTNVIKDNNLKVYSQQLTETDPNIISDNQGQGVTLKEIPFQFEIEGSYSNIVEFFSQLGQIDDFVIIKEMSFSRTTSTGSDGSTVWVLKIVLVKYQFNTGEALTRIYSDVHPTAKYSDKVLDYITKRVSE
jgi:Tfp pilus assembly protein PilO